MRMLSITYKGDFDNSLGFLNTIKRMQVVGMLDECGREGVAALQEATPKDTGLTAASWSYEIEETRDGFTLRWNNSNVQKGVNIALILQRGHGKRNGGYIAGINYINPALAPIFEKIKEKALKEVSK